MSKTVKRLAQAYADIDRTKEYTLSDAIMLVKKGAKAKFDETIDIAINLGIDPRHSDQNIRGIVSLPYGTGKVSRIAVFAKNEKAQEAQKAGADSVGAEDLMQQMKNGDLNYDRVLATPDMMSLVGNLGKLLGPRGLMPTPKVGTVTIDIAQAVSDIKAGQIQFRNDKNGIIHAGIGKASFSSEKLVANAQEFMSKIVKAKPSSSKGTYLKRLTISSTMGVGVKVVVNSIH